MANQKYDAFLTVARLGSFKAAAEELGYTQAGISYLVNALEKELGLTLFLREYGGVHLTTEGREVLGLVQAINADEHALAARVRELADREGGLVRVGAFTSVAIEWFPSIARAFLDQYPKIDLKLLCIDDEEELVNAVWEGRADCAFSIAPERRNLEAVPLHTDPLLVVLPPDHPLAGAPFFPTEALAREPYVQLQGNARPSEMEALFEANGVTPNVRFTVDSDCPWSAPAWASPCCRASFCRALCSRSPSCLPSASAPAASRSPCARATPPRPPPAPSPKSPENGSPSATGRKPTTLQLIHQQSKGAAAATPFARGGNKLQI